MIRVVISAILLLCLYASFVTGEVKTSHAMISGVVTLLILFSGLFAMERRGNFK